MKLKIVRSSWIQALVPYLALLPFYFQTSFLPWGMGGRVRCKEDHFPDSSSHSSGADSHEFGWGHVPVFDQSLTEAMACSSNPGLGHVPMDMPCVSGGSRKEIQDVEPKEEATDVYCRGSASKARSDWLRKPPHTICPGLTLLVLPPEPPVSESAGTGPGDPEAAHALVPQRDPARGAVLPVGTEAAQPDPPRCGKCHAGQWDRPGACLVPPPR